MASFVFKVAKKNTRFSNDVYKLLMKTLKVDKRIPIKIFKDAYHSAKTAPEIRAMALATLYGRKESTMDTFLSTFKSIDRVRTGGVNSLVIGVDRSSGSPRLQLTAYLKDAHKVFNLSTDLKREVRAWEPYNADKSAITRGLEQGSAHALKAALVIEELKKPFVAMAHMIYNNIRYNDPTWWYFHYDDKEMIRNDENSDTVKSFQQNELIYRDDVEHVRKELDKFMPFIEKLGINTFDLHERFETIQLMVNHFLCIDYDDRNDEIKDLHNIHIAGEKLMDTLVKITSELDNFDLSDPRINQIGKYEITPTFVHPRPHILLDHSIKLDQDTASGIIGHIKWLIETPHRGRKAYMENRWTRVYFKDDPDYEP